MASAAQSRNALQNWKSRELNAFYPIIWLDSIRYPATDENDSGRKVLYSVLALSCEGKKDLLGIYTTTQEDCLFWSAMFSDLQSRGVQEIFLVYAPRLREIHETVSSTFAQARLLDIKNQLYAHTLEAYHIYVEKVLRKKMESAEADLEQCVFKAFMQIRRNWTQPVREWEAVERLVKGWDERGRVDNLTELGINYQK